MKLSKDEDGLPRDDEPCGTCGGSKRVVGRSKRKSSRPKWKPCPDCGQKEEPSVQDAFKVFDKQLGNKLLKEMDGWAHSMLYVGFSNEKNNINL
jgi:hypothetical protein